MPFGERDLTYSARHYLNVGSLR